MLGNSPPFSGFSVDDIDAARMFYRNILGLTVTDNEMGFLDLHLAGGARVMVYSKPDHVPATYTVLNFPVADIDAAVDEMAAAGVTFTAYPGLTDEKGIARACEPSLGRGIAWFTDPAGNVMSVLVE